MGNQTLHKDVRILAVDDNRSMLALLEVILKMEGYECVEIARSGMEALKKFPIFKPRVVFLDIEMPEMDGYQTLQAIKEFGITTQVVMLTGCATPDSVRRAKDEGAAGFIVKPITPKRIGDAIQTCIKRAEESAGEIELFVL